MIVSATMKDDSFAIPPCLWECSTNNCSPFFQFHRDKITSMKTGIKAEPNISKMTGKGILLTWLISLLLVVNLKFLVNTYILLFLFLFHMYCLNMWKKASFIELVNDECMGNFVKKLSKNTVLHQIPHYSTHIYIYIYLYTCFLNIYYYLLIIYLFIYNNLFHIITS